MTNNRRYRILILIKCLGLGGAERLIVDSLPYLNQEQFDYHFAYLLSWKDFLVPQIEEAGFPIYCLGMEANYQFPLMLPRLQSLQQKCRFDLIHADMPQAGILARLVGHQHKMPIVYTEHNLQERFHPLTRGINRLTYRWNSQVIAVSSEVAESAARFGLDQKTRVATLMNGVPVEQVRAEANDLNGLREELDIPLNHLIVGTVAVFRRQKRLLDWLDVASKIAAQRKNVTFLLVGHGPEEAAIKAKVQALGLTDRVRMPGFRPDGRRVMGLMDVYLMSSEHEGLPIALLEAMALRKPIVSTAVGGIPELVVSGTDGFLTPAGATNELATYTMKLLDDPECRVQMGQYGAEKVETNFHLKKRVAFIENLYEEMLRN